MNIKVPAVAGLFYPEDALALKSYIHSEIIKHPKIINDPKVLVVPHAGYVYSGGTAAAAFRQLVSSGSEKKIVLIGPSHHHPIHGIALSSADSFQMPLGIVEVDKELTNKVKNHDGVNVNDDAFRFEHSLEVQLPFIYYIFGNSVKLLPLLTNDTSPYILSSVLDTIWDEVDYIIVSTDLSHYLSYERCEEKDKHTADMVEKLDYRNLTSEDACGISGLKAVLLTLEKKNMTLKCLYRCNSGDNGSSREKVVGYAAFCSLGA